MIQICQSIATVSLTAILAVVALAGIVFVACGIATMICELVETIRDAKGGSK